jgi:hypothetical protein
MTARMGARRPVQDVRVALDRAALDAGVAQTAALLEDLFGGAVALRRAGEL